MAPDFPLDDICGAGGRWDLMARCVQASLFISHDLRRDTELMLVVLGPPDPPKTVRISGADVRGLNPDERSTVALLCKVLDDPLPRNGRWVGDRPGIHVARCDLARVLDGLDDGPLVLLEEEGDIDGPDLPDQLGEGSVTFILGDHHDLTDWQLEDVRSRGATEARLGPLSLHADHCITIVHNILDRAGP